MFVVKVPGVNGNKGCKGAGNEIIEKLDEIGSNEQGKLIDKNLLDLEEIHLDNKNLELTNKLIYENAFETFEAKPRTVFLGGDHSISYSLVKAFLNYCREEGDEPCLIVFDSNPNCENPNNFPNNKQWLRKVIDAGFPEENILLVGVRNSRIEEINFLKGQRIRMIDTNKITLDIENICDTIMEFSNRKVLYLSIDVSVVDSAFAPSTSFNEPGGLTSRQLIYLIQRLNRVKGLKAVDIVEIDAEKDKNHDEKTIKLGAKILAEFL
ncbi:MAG: arginase family protein [Nanoarchaeota archaeon]